jgi:Fuc2NAc and GlcNAc transferase
VSAKWRFLVQVVAASLAVYLLGGLPAVQLGNAVVELGLVGDVAVVIFIVWFTNAFNFMDGIDGIAASEAICISGGAVALHYAGGGPAVVLLGVIALAALGFLVWNWAPARIFMGDVGSAFLGFILIAVAIYSSHTGNVPFWSWLILAGVFIVDATITLVVRMWNRENWLSAHRSHAYQRASRRYQSHARVTTAVVAVNILWLLPIAFLATAAPEHGWWLTAIAWLPLTIAALRIGAGKPDQA